MIKLIYRNDAGKLMLPAEVLPSNGMPQSHHFQSTDGDNLIELAGRVCYDSCAAMSKTRGTPEYHQHINEVNHGSVQEHQSIIAQFPPHLSHEDAMCILVSCLNRPGVYATILPNKDNLLCVRITANIRAIKEWNNFLPNRYMLGPLIAQRVGDALKVLAMEQFPLSLGEFTTWKDNPLKPIIAAPLLPEETWLSFYTNEISRGLTHELVRHKYHTAVSQRSTRYVDESESSWAWHPLILKYEQKIYDFYRNSGTGDWLDQLKDFAQSSYKDIVKVIEESLIAEGIDKFTARKQARGASRGILGNALSTELIWSASLDEIKRVLVQRASAHADAEIRVWANQLYEIVQPLYPEYFEGKRSPCPDGIGYSVEFLS